MNLSSKIKLSIVKITLELWPLPEKQPSAKPLNLPGSKIILLYNFSTEKEQKLLTNQISYIKKQLVTSSLLTICNMSNVPLLLDSEDIVYFSSNDFDLFGKPKSKLNNWINNNEFDILISFVTKENVYCNKMVSDIKSEFKAGFYDPNNVKLFDLTIKQETDNINNQLELFIRYLNKLNINK